MKRIKVSKQIHAYIRSVVVELEALLQGRYSNVTLQAKLDAVASPAMLVKLGQDGFEQNRTAEQTAVNICKVFGL